MGSQLISVNKSQKAKDLHSREGETRGGHKAGLILSSHRVITKLEHKQGQTLRLQDNPGTAGVFYRSFYWTSCEIIPTEN